MTAIALAAAYWLALHLVVAGPLRSPIVDKLGEKAFFIAFSLLTVVGLAGFVYAYRHAPWIYLWHTPPVVGGLAISFVSLAFLLSVLGGRRNPTDTHAPPTVDGRLAVYGVTRITRHPRLCGLTLWATAHMLVNGHLAAFVMFGSLLVTVVNGMVSIDRKKRRKFGVVWDDFEAQTSRLPFAAILAGRTRFEPREFSAWQFAQAAAVFAAVFVVHGFLGPSPLFILQG